MRDNCEGYLNVSADKLWWEPVCSKPAYEAPRAALGNIKRYTGKYNKQIVGVEINGKRRDYSGAPDGSSKYFATLSMPLAELLDKVFRDFASAEAEFSKLRGEAPKAPLIDDGFRAKAAAWRALEVKPDISEDVRRQKLLAESYFREKDTAGAIEHYEAGVTASPVWPEGWFNLGLLYAEVGDYFHAADRMKHYLELMPNAPDAAAVRDKLIIWEDRAAKQ